MVHGELLPRRWLGAAAGLAAALGVCGCGAGATTTATATESSQSPGPATSVATPAPRAHHRHRPPQHYAHRPAPAPRPRELPVSTASNAVVQPQPPPGSCHAIGSGPDSRPDPRCTPGAVNPAVTQATIHATICVSGWTASVRPAEAITEREKAASMAAYGDPGPMGAYEYDHLVPLELGGATNDSRNLWPEPGASPNPKDSVEGELRAQVCDGQMPLAAAQRAIAANWVALARRAPPAALAPASPASPASPAQSTSSAPGGSAECTVTAVFSSHYGDYDVYVHSNQPDQTVTVTDTAGRSRSWHTDGAGYADVYFRRGAAAAGDTLTARVGGASCSTTL